MGQPLAGFPFKGSPIAASVAGYPGDRMMGRSQFLVQA